MKIGYLKYAYPEQRCIINKLGGGRSKIYILLGETSKNKNKG
jgi:hypothetical protein